MTQNAEKISSFFGDNQLMGSIPSQLSAFDNMEDVDIDKLALELEKLAIS